MKTRILSMLLSVLLCCAAPLTLSSCEGKQKKDGLSIVATVFPAYDFARQITNNTENITMLLSPGQEVHTYEPSPRDIITVQECDLFLYIGGESESWVEKLLSSLDTKPKHTVRLLDCIPPLQEDDHEHAHPVLDEHIWTSPKNAILMTQAICDALCQVNAEKDAFYKENTQSYLASLQALDHEYSALFSQNFTLVVADRFPFRHLAYAYGVTYRSAYPGCSNDAEVSAATVRELIDLVKDEQIPVIFTVEFSNGRLADTVCEETGCRRLELHSCHNVSKDDFECGITYLALMQRNIAHLKEAVQ